MQNCALALETLEDRFRCLLMYKISPEILEHLAIQKFSKVFGYRFSTDHLSMNNGYFQQKFTKISVVSYTSVLIRYP